MKFNKEKAKGFFAGMAMTIILVLSTSFVFASVANKNIKVNYKNIKLYIEDVLVIPKDANGNVVEPFEYNGTTYLPIRSIANALGKDVAWDSKTNSIYLGKHIATEVKTALTDLNYSKRTNADQQNKWSGKNNQGDYYDSAILLKTSMIGNEGKCYISYKLDSKYQKLTAKTFVPESSKNANGTVNLSIYGDDKLLYASSPISGTNRPTDFSISVKGVSTLRIEISMSQSNSNNTSMSAGIADSELY
jgi:hypothetical protein